MCLQPVVLWSALWHSPGFPAHLCRPWPQPRPEKPAVCQPCCICIHPTTPTTYARLPAPRIVARCTLLPEPPGWFSYDPMNKKKSREVTIFLTELAWRRPGDKPLFEPKMVSLLMHINASLSLNELKRQSGYFFPFKKARKDIFFNVLHILLFENKQSKLLIDSKFPEHWNITKLY